MLGKTSWYSIDVSANDRHILLFYKKCHFCHLLPFAKVGQIRLDTKRDLEGLTSTTQNLCINIWRVSSQNRLSAIFENFK